VLERRPWAVEEGDPRTPSRSAVNHRAGFQHVSSPAL
jgi:hypothetical protein